MIDYNVHVVTGCVLCPFRRGSMENAYCCHDLMKMGNTMHSTNMIEMFPKTPVWCPLKKEDTLVSLNNPTTQPTGG